MIPFGIGGAFIVCYLNPILMKWLSLLPNNTIILISSILAALFLIDNLISIPLIINFKKLAQKTHKDSTDEIKKYITKHISSEKNLYKRLFNSFPELYKVKKNKKK